MAAATIAKVVRRTHQGLAESVEVVVDPHLQMAWDLKKEGPKEVAGQVEVAARAPKDRLRKAAATTGTRGGFRASQRLLWPFRASQNNI